MRAARKISPRQFACFALVACAVLLVNFSWLIPFIEFAELKTNSAFHLQGSAHLLVQDIFGVGSTDGAPRWWRITRSIACAKKQTLFSSARGASMRI